MSQRTCVTCAADLSTEHSNRIYCSERCKHSSRPRIPCSTCGEPSGYALSMRSRVDASRVQCRPCRNATWEHGTGVSYRRYKCRCDECRAWNTEDAKRYRERRRSRGTPPAKRKKPWAGKVQTCEQCGEQFRRQVTQRFCSLACNGLAQRKVKSRELVHVGPVVPKDAPPTPVTVVSLPKWWAVLTSGPCAWCGEHFIGVGTQAAYCKRQCGKDARDAKRGGRFVIEPRIRRAIYERDDFTCQLCNEPVDLAADPRSDWYPSLDHIVPQSRMLIPDHSPANLRTAHRWCNAVRGDGTRHADIFEGVA